MEKFLRYHCLPCKPLGKDRKCVTGSKEHIELSRKAACEGMVLLKNEQGTLPLKKGSKIALFGQGSLNYIKGGGGSGDVYCEYIRNIFDGFEIKENEGKVAVFKPLKEFYRNHIESDKCRIKVLLAGGQSDAIYKITNIVERDIAIGEFTRDTQISEPSVPYEIINNAAAFADTAIITISRYSGEGFDRSPGKGDFYLSDIEENLVKSVKKAFKRCIVVLNVGGVIDTEWFKHDDEIGAVLLGWQAGMEGGLAVADILCGDINPSGKLTDTFAKSIQDYPGANKANEYESYVNYYEDIYVGYRYFETIPGAKARVNYPFGFGLSYTSFKLSKISVSADEKDVCVCLNVTNTGSVAGKEVVQVYYSAPQGKLSKPKLSLCAFTKTKLLLPKESEDIRLTFAIKDMASYDDLGEISKSAYVLEKGDYEFFVGTSVRDTVKADFVYSIAEDLISEQLESRCAPIELDKRMLSNGEYEAIFLRKLEYKFGENKENTVTKPSEPTYFDVSVNESNLDKFLTQFTDRELCEFMGGKPSKGVCNTSCFSGLLRLGVPDMPTADGPAGLRLERKHGIPTTAWPCATLLACTWNTDVVKKIGKAGGLEVKENNIAFWLTPALNIHRTPLCGRNFEYFSEDPLVSGEMAAAKVIGMQSVGTGCSVKHFACNNTELDRTNSDSRVSERALREIYLKGFEICVKKAKPYSVMSSYNMLNGVHTSERYDLLTGILRTEWGFDGFVTTDWGVKNNPVNEARAGNDMKMHYGYPDDLEAALKNGSLTRADLELCAKRVLKVYLKFE